MTAVSPLTASFYRAGFPLAADRLRNYLGRVEAGVVDEPGSVRALASFVLRGVHRRALDDAEVARASGLDRRALDALVRRKVA